MVVCLFFKGKVFFPEDEQAGINHLWIIKFASVFYQFLMFFIIS